MMQDNVTPTTLRTAPGDVIKKIPVTTQEEIDDFFKSISESKTKPAILSVISDYSKDYIPKELKQLPKPLTFLFREENAKMSFQELLILCQGAEISITADDCHNIEVETKAQASSRVWFEQRAGRITASKFKSACHTNPEKPSISLVKAICYPAAHQFSSAATRYLYVIINPMYSTLKSGSYTMGKLYIIKNK